MVITHGLREIIGLRARCGMNEWWVTEVKTWQVAELETAERSTVF